MVIETTRYPYPAPARILTGPQSVTLAIASVGANIPARDSIDARLITELTSYGKLGQLISDETASPMYGPGTIASGTKPVDTDGDGIPDAIETKFGWNPNVADSTKVGSSGYSNLEVWANSLVPSSY